jgi:glycine oxidase
VLVIGDGVIGLSAAYALGQAGAECTIVGARNPGMASVAAAGLLLPNLDELPAPVRPFFSASLQGYPAFVEKLRDYDASLALIQGVTDLTRGAGPLGVLNRTDAAVDNVRLVAALRAAVRDQPAIRFVEDDPVQRIDLDGARCAALTRSGGRLTAERIVVAAGAWAPNVKGLPRSLHVQPLKGQMLALAASPLEHPVVGDGVYLVPRRTETLVGATVENAGFDLTIDDGAIEQLRRRAVAACPALAGASIARTWAGTRPATPDMLPIISTDPSDERLIYACGHSKNGILLAPATASAVVVLALAGGWNIDLSPFAVTRFSGEQASAGR